MFKYIVTGALGLAVGGVAGYLYGKKKLEKEVQAEIDEFKKEYKERMACPDKVEPEEKKIYKTAEKPVLKSEIMDGVKQEEIINYAGYSAKGESMPSENVNLTKKAKESAKNRKAEKYKDYKNYDPDDYEEEEEFEEEDEGFVDAFPKEGPTDLPYSISPETFANENPYFDKVTLMYYAGDDTLTDEDENIINDEIGSTLGISFRNWFGEYETNVAYVRNEKMSTDYEVLYLEGRYTES